MSKNNKYIVCGFPLCGKSHFSTKTVDLHHIVPVSMGGEDSLYNRIYLCPECHRRIYVPGIASGIHKTKKQGSVQLFRYIPTNKGKALLYRDVTEGAPYRLWFSISGTDMPAPASLTPGDLEQAT